MLPGDRLVCVFTEPQPVGREFKTWLLHVTIVPWFRLPDETAAIAEGLAKALTDVKPFSSAVGETEMFGPKRQRPAHLMESAGFPEVENKVRTYLHKKRAWLVDETTKRKRQFKPHVTYQNDTHLAEGDSIKVDRAYIVEQLGGHKRIAAEVTLG